MCCHSSYVGASLNNQECSTNGCQYQHQPQHLHCLYLREVLPENCLQSPAYHIVSDNTTNKNINLPVDCDEQYRTAPYNTIKDSTVPYNTIQYSAVQYSAVQYGAIQYSTVQYSTVQCNTVQYNQLAGKGHWNIEIWKILQWYQLTKYQAYRENINLGEETFSLPFSLRHLSRFELRYFLLSDGSNIYIR